MGLFAGEIVPVKVKNASDVIRDEEYLRIDLKKLRLLKPAFLTSAEQRKGIQISKALNIH